MDALKTLNREQLLAVAKLILIATKETSQGWQLPSHREAINETGANAISILIAKVSDGECEVFGWNGVEDFLKIQFPCNELGDIANRIVDEATRTVVP